MAQDIWNPSQYEKFKDQRAKPFWDLADLVSRDASIYKMIDLGCGTGELTARLHEKLAVRETLGIDNSASMLAQAPKVSGVRFQEADLSTFTPASKFDLVFSNAALQWLPDHEVLFPRIFSWVAPSGQIAIQMPANHEHASHRLAHSVAQEMFPGRVAKEQLNVLDVDSYATMLFEHGFTDCRSRVEVYLHPMKNGADVVEWTKGSTLTRYQKVLNSTDFEAYVAEYRKQLVSVIGEGPYVYPFKRLLLWGRLTRP